MKKIYLILIGILAIVGCSETEEKREKFAITCDIEVIYSNGDVDTLRVDGLSDYSDSELEYLDKYEVRLNEGDLMFKTRYVTKHGSYVKWRVFASTVRSYEIINSTMTKVEEEYVEVEEIPNL